MAQVARDYHDYLQDEGLNLNLSVEDHKSKTKNLLNHIPAKQKITEQTMSEMNRPIEKDQVREAIFTAKSGTATRIDGCPYELWKKLVNEHEIRSKKDLPSFDLIQALTEILTDIQENGIDPRMNFTLGWMCPIYKKKDPTEISNYRPITLLNTDYKILTKIMAMQLMKEAQKLVHEDQAGFIPKRLIFNHIRLARAIINYAEIAEEDGAIIALDQEKAYNKI